MFCKHCGTQLPDNTQVCPQCSTPLTLRQAAVPPAAPAAQPAAPAAQPVAPPQSAAAPQPSAPKKKKGKLLAIVLSALAVIVIAFVVLIATHVICISHNFQDATCTSPKTCKYCKEEEGRPLDHSWKDASCTAPKTCDACGKTEGDPLGHKWNDATCSVAQTCKVCNQTEGTPIGHKWNAATCTKPKTCQFCDATEGAALGHTEGPWEETKPATLTQSGTEAKFCTACDALLENHIITKKSPQALSTSFNFTDEEFIEWMNQEMTTYIDSTPLEPDDSSDENATAYLITMDDGVAGAIIFSHDVNDYISSISVYFEEWSDSAAIILSIGSSISPQFSFDDGADNLVYDLPYTGGNMTAMTIMLDSQAEMVMLMPANIYSEST